MSKVIHAVYEIRNITNNKIYVGSSVDFERRCNHHKSDLRKNIHANSHLQRAWNKYGESVFVFSVLEVVEDKTKLIEREQFYIDSLCPYYNMLKKAGNSLYVSDYTREVLRSLSKGRKHTEETKEICRLMNLGRTHSESSRKNMSDSRKNYFSSEENRKKHSASCKGKVLSDVHRKRIGDARRGKHMSDISKERSSATQSFPIVQLTLSGNFIAEFPSSKAVASALSCYGETVKECCRGNISSYKGYKFVYKKDYKPLFSYYWEVKL